MEALGSFIANYARKQWHTLLAAMDKCADQIISHYDAAWQGIQFYIFFYTF